MCVVAQELPDCHVYCFYRVRAKSRRDVFRHFADWSPRRLPSVSCTTRTRELVQHERLGRVRHPILEPLKYKRLSFSYVCYKERFSNGFRQTMFYHLEKFVSMKRDNNIHFFLLR